MRKDALQEIERRNEITYALGLLVGMTRPDELTEIILSIERRLQALEGSKKNE